MAKIKLNAALRKTAGVREIFIEGASLNQVLSELVANIPALESSLMQDGQFQQHNLVIVNGHHVVDLDLILADDDTISIFPPISGG